MRWFPKSKLVYLIFIGAIAGVLVLINLSKTKQDQDVQKSAENSEQTPQDDSKSDGISTSQTATRSLEDIKNGSLNDDEKKLLLEESANISIQSEKYEQAIKYYEALLDYGLTEDAKDIITYQIILAAEKLENKEIITKYTNLLGEAKLNDFKNKAKEDEGL